MNSQIPNSCSNGIGFLEEALEEFMGYLYMDGALQLPPLVAFERLQERAGHVLDKLPKTWAHRRVRRLAKSMSATAAMGFKRRSPNSLQLAIRMSRHNRDRRRFAAQMGEYQPSPVLANSSYQAG